MMLGTPESESACAQEAAKYGVIPHIHPDDLLLTHIAESLGEGNAIQEYFRDGRNSAEKLKSVLSSAGVDVEKEFSLLDFASGYGMVARHYATILPHSRVTACDIHPAANTFNGSHFNVATHPSTTAPEDLQLDSQFDVVFALSFFSHLPLDSFSRWLNTLYAFVKKGGVLIFTTHGCFSKPPVTINPDDHMFIKVREQSDLDSAAYGTSWVSPTFVIKRLKELAGAEPTSMKIACVSEAFWWEHQDMYVVTKSR